MIENRKISTYSKNVADLSDTPSSDGMSADQLKKFFDGRTDEEVKTSINGIIEDLLSSVAGSSGADNIKISLIAERIATNVQEIIEELDADVKDNTRDSHTHENKTTLDAITDLVKEGYDDVVTLLEGISGIEKLLTSTDLKLPTSKAVMDAINKKITEIGAADMQKAVYDKNDNGKVDNAEEADNAADSEKLGGHLPEYYATKEECDAKGNVVMKRIRNSVVTVSSWEADTTFPDFPYKADIVVEGITDADWKTSDMYTADAFKENISPDVFTGDNLVRIFASEIPDHDITFDSMDITKAVV